MSVVKGLIKCNRLRTSENTQEEIANLKTDVATKATKTEVNAISSSLSTYATQEYVESIVGGNIDTFSDSFDTLKEITEALEELKVPNNAPLTATSAGVAGEIRYDTSFVYICVATNQWKRALISHW